MSSFGENLRREREMRGVTLEEISAATKISVRFLACVENEDFSKLPGGIFARSFIRSYGRYLGLDEEALLAEFQQAMRGRGEQDISHFAILRPLPAEKKASRTARIGLPLVVILLLVAGYAIWRHSRLAPLPGLNAVTALPKAVASPATATAPAAASSAANLAAVSPNNNGSTAAAASSGGAGASANNGAEPGGGSAAQVSSSASSAAADQSGLNLQIAAAERSWVTVSADGVTVFQGILHANDVKTFHATKDFDVLTGNAQGVILTLNGQTLKPMGQEGEVKSVHLTRKNLSQPAP